MTYLEVVAQIKSNRKRHAEQLKEQAVMDHTQASLMAFALNDPQKMPSLAKAYPFLEQESGQEPQQDSETASVAHEAQPVWQNDQAMLIQQAMVVKATLRRKKAQQRK